MHRTLPVAIAIVGLGVRGLSVLERIISHAALDPTSELCVHLADSRPAQPLQYDISQPDYLLLNHSCGYVSMFPARQSVPCAPAMVGPNLYEWALERGLCVAEDGFTVGTAGRPVEPADNLPRRVFGEYLRWFYQWLRDHAPENVRLVEHVATAVDLSSDGDTSILCLDDGTRVEADYVFVTVGQRPRRRDRESGRLISKPYPLPGQLDRVRPSETVAIAGLGLTAADAILALTVGRGGRFDRTVTPERYVASGEEPRIVVYSRSGRAYRARPAPSDVVSYPPVVFTREAVDELRTRTPLLDYDRDLLPLLLLELRVAYRRATVRRDAGPQEAETFLLGARAAAAEGTLDTWAALPDSAEFDVEAAYHGSAAPDAKAPADGDAYQRSVESWMAADIAHAARGFEDSPFKAATETCREVRDTLRYAIDFGGLTDASLDRFYGYHMEAINRLVIGPEKERAANILTLLRSGVVSMPVGPNPLVTENGESGWTLSSTELAQPTKAHAAWLYTGHPDRLDSPERDTSIVGAMVRRGTARRFRPDSAVVPTVDVDSHGHPIAADGRPAARIWMFGLLCEGATFYNGYLTSPWRFERAQSDTDRAVHELFARARSRRPAVSASEKGFRG